MKKLLLTIILASNFIVAQTTWDGPTMTFTKADNADPTLEANQDRITSNVWLTRGNSGGQIYNAKTESSFQKQQPGWHSMGFWNYFQPRIFDFFYI